MVCVMNKKYGPLILGVVTLVVGLVLLFITPSIWPGKETTPFLIGSVTCFVGTQTIVRFIIEAANERDSEK